MWSLLLLGVPFRICLVRDIYCLSFVSVMPGIIKRVFFIFNKFVWSAKVALCNSLLAFPVPSNSVDSKNLPTVFYGTFLYLVMIYASFSRSPLYRLTAPPSCYFYEPRYRPNSFCPRSTMWIVMESMMEEEKSFAEAGYDLVFLIAVLGIKPY